jgi:hypothetical protein
MAAWMRVNIRMQLEQTSTPTDVCTTMYEGGRERERKEGD